MRPVKIVAIGPESTGKSTLCAALAEHYNSRWVPEFARQYLLAHPRGYSYSDLLVIAQGQIHLEETLLAEVMAQEGQMPQTRPSSGPGDPTVGATGRPPLLFIDTDMYVMKVWCEYVFERCHPWILDQIARRPYDFYLLCNNDLPWVRDELREYPDLATREKLFQMYKDILINQDLPWIEIRGSHEKRSQQAIAAVDRWTGRSLPPGPVRNA
jgi:nicotinamide riboside kinase